MDEDGGPAMPDWSPYQSFRALLDKADDEVATEVVRMLLLALLLVLVLLVVLLLLLLVLVLLVLVLVLLLVVVPL